MGEKTDIIEAVAEAIERRRSPLMQFLERNIGASLLVTLLGGGTLSGVATDRLAGGQVARAESAVQLELVLETANRSIDIAHELRIAAEAERDRALVAGAAAHALFLDCVDARLDPGLDLSF